MAKFSEVMRQWQRMCKSMQMKNMSCKEDCLLGHNPTCGELEYASLEEINNAETAIMKWAAEQPEPVYPTWGEWLQEIGVAQVGSGMLSIHPAIAEQPIPASFAREHGIEPKVDA